MSARRAICACCDAVQVSRRSLTASASVSRFSVEPRRTARALRRHERPRETTPVPQPAPQQPPTRQEPIDPSNLPWTQYGNVPNSDARASSSLLPYNEVATPVEVPADPKGLIQPDSTAAKLLAQPALIVVRQLEMLNLFIGFEQASRFQIMSPSGEPLGYLLEENQGFGSMIGRQMLRTHRAFKCTVMDTAGNIVLRIQRPVSIINSRITVTAGSDDPGVTDVPVIGEARQIWNIYRRKYDLYIRAREGEDENAFQQFAAIDSGFLAWDFDALDSENKVCASISRRWAGFGREIFTDTGQYVLRFDAVVDDASMKLLTSGSMDSSRATHNQHVAAADKAASASEEDREKALVLAKERTTQGLTLDQRAVLLACAVSIDVDYFSRSRGSPGADMMMLPLYGGFGAQPAETAEGSGIEGGEIENEGGSSSSGDGDSQMPEAPPQPTDTLPEDYEESMPEEQPFSDPWGADPGDKWQQGGQSGGDSWWSGGGSSGDSGGDWGDGGDW